MLMSSSMWQPQSHVVLLFEVTHSHTVSHGYSISLYIYILFFSFLFQLSSLSSYSCGFNFPSSLSFTVGLKLRKTNVPRWRNFTYLIPRLERRKPRPINDKCTGTGLVSANFPDLFASAETDGGCFRVSCS